MKMLRLIVSIRLASFSLIFNLSIAQELDVETENSEKISTNFSEPHPNPLLLGEGNHEVVGEVYSKWH